MKVLMVIFITLFIIGSPSYAKRGEAVMIVGYLNPDFKGRKIKKIMVNVKNADFFYTDQIEIRVEDAIEDESDETVDVVQYHRAFPPIKEFTGAEIESFIKKEDIDAVLFISIAGDNESVSSGWSFSAGPGGASGGSYSSKFRYTNALVELIDSKTKTLIWGGKGKFIARGDSKKSYMRNSKRLAKHIANLFEESGLYPKVEGNRKQSAPGFGRDRFQYTP